MTLQTHNHSPIRCFIALTIPADAQQHLNAVQNLLRKNSAQARWVNAKHIHITIRFLGDRDPSRVTEFITALPQIVQDFKGHPVRIDSLGAFPDIHKPRILWAGISSGSERVTRLAEEINTGLARLGIPKDPEGFVPHLTLARCKTPQESRSCYEAIIKVPAFSIETRIKSLTFFQSVLSACGPIYQPLWTSPEF